MTMLQRENADEEPTAVFTENELNILDKLVKPKRHETSQSRSLSNYIRKMAKLWGYLAQASAPPGTKFIVGTCAKRMTKDGGTSVAEVMTESVAQGVHQIRGRTKEGENYQAALEIKFEKLLIHPPVA